MKATFADFSVIPPRLSNAAVRYEACHAAGSHLAMGAGGSVTLDFEVKEREEIAEATLKVTALVSKLGPSMGFAPMGVLVNGEVVADRLTIPGGGDLPQDNVLAVPGRLLTPGTNTLEIRSSDEARSMLWLYRITLDSVYQRGRSERALGAEADTQSVFAFRTRLRVLGSGPWVPAPGLLFHIDRGEQSVPAQLSWRGTDGAESSISFASNMSDFYGHHRAADGTPAEFRGSLTGRYAFPEGTDKARVYRFHPEEGWGGGWHASGELRLLLEDGGAPLERIAWRDQRNNSGSITLGTALEVVTDAAPTARSPYDFLGFYQRYNEGAIGYRGTAVPTTAPS